MFSVISNQNIELKKGFIDKSLLVCVVEDVVCGGVCGLVMFDECLDIDYGLCWQFCQYIFYKVGDVEKIQYFGEEGVYCDFVGCIEDGWCVVVGVQCLEGQGEVVEGVGIGWFELQWCQCGQVQWCYVGVYVFGLGQCMVDCGVYIWVVQLGQY